MLWNLVLGLLIIACLLLATAIKPKAYPPGPLWFPLLGCYKQVKEVYSKKKYYHLVWNHFQKMYGSVVGIKLGSDKIVIISGYDAVQQVLLRKEFEGRPNGYFFRLRSFGERLGVVFVDGSFMRVQRKYCLYQLRQVGFGKSTMNDVITREALELLDLIMIEHKNGPLKVQLLFEISALNTIWTMLTGHRFQLKDERLQKLLDMVHTAFRLVDMTGGVLNQMPFLRFIAPSLCGYNSIVEIVDRIVEFLEEVVNSHGDTNGNNFVSIFLQEVQNSKNDKNTTFSKKQLLILLEDFFMAGTETTSNTLTFITFYLIKYPQIQNKIHHVLDKVVGSDQTPTMEHRDKLAYLEAVIMEVQRHANPVALAIAHRAMQDTELMNYKIPKDTTILPSIWSVHMEKSYWKDPYVFRPERFIDSEGKIIQNSHFMPFGIGKRRCIGEVLAKTSLFLFLAILLQKFKLESTMSIDDLKLEVLDGVTLSPAPFEVKFILR